MTEGFFSVMPKEDCPHVRGLLSEDDEGVLSVLDAQRLESAFATPCSSCAASGLDRAREENWLCLRCTMVFCSRYVRGHMSSHNVANRAEHTIALSLSDLSVWCYECDTYIKSKLLQSLLLHVEALKFGSPKCSEDTSEVVISASNHEAL